MTRKKILVYIFEFSGTLGGLGPLANRIPTYLTGSKARGNPARTCGTRLQEESVELFKRYVLSGRALFRFRHVLRTRGYFRIDFGGVAPAGPVGGPLVSGHSARLSALFSLGIAHYWSEKSLVANAVQKFRRSTLLFKNRVPFQRHLV